MRIQKALLGIDYEVIVVDDNSPDGTAEGEIYMAKPKAQWLVTDLQLSLAQMAVKREKPKEKFFPSAYRWLLEE